jgi:hypothetical protein
MTIEIICRCKFIAGSTGPSPVIWPPRQPGSAARQGRDDEKQWCVHE